MSEEMSQEEIIQQQKENCIFCKIVAGEIPARKVYEDEHMIAILDIHPAAKGHVLVLPKEHYPILPVIPFHIIQHLFKHTHKLIGAIKKAMMVPGVTMFVANGAVAGQQSPHFLYHLIPREHGDMLPLEAPSNGNPAENAQANAQIAGKIKQFMQAYLQEVGRTGLAAQESETEPEQSSITHTAIVEEQEPVSENAQVDSRQLDRLITEINNNEDLMHAVVEQPDEVKRLVASNEKWKELFGNVDIDQLSSNLKVMIAKNQKNKDKNNLDQISKVL